MIAKRRSIEFTAYAPYNQLITSDNYFGVAASLAELKSQLKLEVAKNSGVPADKIVFIYGYDWCDPREN